jgi:hypothetical protein
MTAMVDSPVPGPDLALKINVFTVRVYGKISRPDNRSYCARVGNPSTMLRAVSPSILIGTMSLPNGVSNRPGNDGKFLLPLD